MTVSIVVSTFNGEKKLSPLLAAIRALAPAPDEVIVVNDGSTDKTLELLSAWHQHLPNLRVIDQTNQGRSRVRNRGAMEARSDLLVFFDDDVTPREDCLREHLSHHQKKPGSIQVGAAIDGGFADPNEIETWKHALSVQWEQSIRGFYPAPLPAEFPFCAAANMSLSRWLFQELGGFDSALTDCEDHEFGARARALGIEVFYNPLAFAWHRDALTTASYVRRLREYARAQGRLSGRLSPASLMPWWKKAVFRLFCQRVWIEAIDREWFRWLPQMVRYRLYDLIVTANSTVWPELVDLTAATDSCDQVANSHYNPLPQHNS